jgi:YHS domain-containing protein
MAMKTLLLYLVSILAGSAMLTPALAQTEPDKRKKQFNLESGVALQGYDPVAYFTQNKAVKGTPANTYAHQGVTYRFASTQHLEAFKANPAKYEPAYGGWCAYAMGATGEKVDIDPETFKITDGRLNLFYNKFFNNTLPKWNKDEANLKGKAGRQLEQVLQTGRGIKPFGLPKPEKFGERIFPDAFSRRFIPTHSASHLSTHSAPLPVMKKPTLYLTWALQGLAALIMVQSLFFKFSAAPESLYIFEKVGLGDAGRIGTGVAEGIASVLLLIRPRPGWAPCWAWA